MNIELGKPYGPSHYAQVAVSRRATEVRTRVEIPHAPLGLTSLDFNWRANRNGGWMCLGLKRGGSRPAQLPALRLGWRTPGLSIALGRKSDGGFSPFDGGWWNGTLREGVLKLGGGR